MRTDLYWRRMLINTSFDFRKDTPGYPKTDPDAYSPTLRRYHKFLWSRPLPGGAHFDLDDTRRDAYLYHGSTLGEFFLASDSVIPRSRDGDSLRRIPSSLRRMRTRRSCPSASR
jgi:hypothetical protein